MDWNGDGLLDIIVGDRDGLVHYYRRTSNMDVAILTKEPDIACAGVTINAGLNSAPAIVDWNEDGKLDMVLGRYIDSSPEVHTVRLYLNESTTSEPVFNSYVNIQSGGVNIGVTRNSPQVYDLNQDGKKDLICGSKDYNVYYYENVGTNAAPVFSGYTIIAHKYYGMRLWIDDWNEDGFPDMLTSDYNGYVWIWIQQPTGVAGSTTPAPSRGLSASSNPFMELVTITGEDFSGGTIQIFDNSGRTVLEAPFSGSFAWDGCGSSSGIYFVRVTDNSGSSSLKLMKI